MSKTNRVSFEASQQLALALARRLGLDPSAIVSASWVIEPGKIQTATFEVIVPDYDMREAMRTVPEYLP